MISALSCPKLKLLHIGLRGAKKPFQSQCKTRKLLCDTQLYCPAAELKAASQASPIYEFASLAFRVIGILGNASQIRVTALLQEAQQFEFRKEKRSLVSICNSIKIQSKIPKYLQY